jgi:hypothetical protein
MLPKSPASPIPGVLIVQWTKFVMIMARHPKNYTSPRGRRGMFGADMRGLVDVGFAQDPRKVIVGGETGVWDADFKAPLTKEKFLASGPAQYAAFSKSMTKLLPHALPHVGTKIDGTSCTLSGLLGAGHHAGAAGLASWVKDPSVRKKFSRTTDAFHLANGVF